LSVKLFLKFWNLREHYRSVFWRGDMQEEHLKAIIKDLREFCRADQSCVVVAKDGRIDTHATAVAEGRREVWLRITQTLNLSDETLQRFKDQEDA
jgi:hypothetical protein